MKIRKRLNFLLKAFLSEVRLIKNSTLQMSFNENKKTISKATSIKVNMKLRMIKNTTLQKSLPKTKDNK